MSELAVVVLGIGQDMFFRTPEARVEEFKSLSTSIVGGTLDASGRDLCLRLASSIAGSLPLLSGCVAVDGSV